MQFLQNIKLLTLIRLEQIYREYFDLNTLLGLAIAGCAGYFFQSKYVITMVADQNDAKIVAMLACVGLTILVKNLSFRIDENPRWAPSINRYVKTVFGGAIVLALLAFDSYTSNTAIENAGLEKTANTLESRIDPTKVGEYKANKKRLEGLFAYYEQREKEFNVSYRSKKNELADKIAAYDRMISETEKANQKTIAEANALRIATVSDGEERKTKSAYFGTSLLLLAFGIEWLSTGARHERRSAEAAIDRIPYSVSAMAMATIYNRHTSVELRHTTTETAQKIPLETIRSILQPKDGNEAIELYAMGAIGNGDGWTIRKIAKNFYGNENKRTHVNGLIQSRREILASTRG